MTPRHHPPGGSALAFQDDQALQTDVMRFLAILALCLMAVFALVQGLPQADRHTPTPPASDHRLEDLERRNRSLTEAREAAQQEILDLRRQLHEREQALAELRDRLARASSELARARQALRRSPGEPRPAAEEKTAPRPAPASEATAADRDQGFALHFASDQALFGLMTSGQVQVYARQGKRFWRILTKGEAFQALPAPAPARYYEMTLDTVPPSLQAALTDHPAEWGVVLPDVLASRIAQAIRGRTGGELVILASGQVELRRWGQR